VTRSTRKFRLASVLAVLAAAVMAATAHAQEGPVRILVGFGPGSTSDAVARLLADRMKASLAAPVIVDNRPGANGFIAAEAVKNAKPDGKTLMIAPIAVTVFAPLTHANLRFDPIKDFAPVSLVANFQFALAVGPATPTKTLPEHVAWLRANPAKAAYGLPLAGGPGHFLGVMVARETGVHLTFVTYKGGGPLVTDLIGGQVPAGIALVSDMIKQHQAKKLTMLAVFGPERSPAAPEVPTAKEAGLGAIQGGLGWHAFHTTAGTPRPAIDRLSAAAAAAIKAPEVSERLVALGLEPVGSTPDELARRVVEDIATWRPAIKASGFRADE
jgi:tripartite-type tricarboxylate transporter receptor subunit TctC